MGKAAKDAAFQLATASTAQKNKANEPKREKEKTRKEN